MARRYPAGWQGISRAPACHPPKPATLHQHKRWFLLTMKNRFPLAVFTLSLNASRCPHRTLWASSFGSHRQLRSLPQHPVAGFHHFFLIKTTSKQWCKVLAGSREDAPFVGSTTSTGRSASPSLHQPGSEMGRAKLSSWHRSTTKLRMAGHLLFWLKIFLPSLSSPEEQTGGFWLHLTPRSHSRSSTRHSRAAASGTSMRGCSGHFGDLLSICLL